MVDFCGFAWSQCPRPPYRPRILLVDDYRNAAESTALFLSMSGRGYDVRIAYTAGEAKTIAESFRPDLLVTEAALIECPPEPRTCGFCLGKEIMKRYHCKGVMLTMLGLQPYVEKAKRRGFARHLGKPCEPAVLEAVNEEVLKENTSGRDRTSHTVSR